MNAKALAALDRLLLGTSFRTWCKRRHLTCPDDGTQVPYDEAVDGTFICPFCSMAWNVPDLLMEQAYSAMMDWAMFLYNRRKGAVRKQDMERNRVEISEALVGEWTDEGYL